MWSWWAGGGRLPLSDRLAQGCARRSQDAVSSDKRSRPSPAAGSMSTAFKAFIVKFVTIRQNPGEAERNPKLAKSPFTV